VLDTRFFDESFKARLLASIEDFDAQCDGLLVHSENFQALHLLQERYREQVKCVYIDPPYNTGGDGFVYKDSYQHSSWMTLLENRIAVARELMSSEAGCACNLNDIEDWRMRGLVYSLFDSSSYITTLQQNVRPLQVLGLLILAQWTLRIELLFLPKIGLNIHIHLRLFQNLLIFNIFHALSLTSRPTK